VADLYLIVSVVGPVSIALGLVVGLVMGIRSGSRDAADSVVRLRGDLRRAERVAMALQREVDALQARGRLHIVGGRHAG
jgi:hypothetical protein